VIRAIEPLRPLPMSILSKRRTLQPYGLAGGEVRACGLNPVVRNDGVVINVGGRCTKSIDIGERLRLLTPGGGGYGSVVRTGSWM
jgi:5-oxoprolinase (ATP-hydrolysing)